MRARIPRAVWGGTPIAPPPCVRLASAACIATIGALALRASAAAAQTPLDMPEQPPETPPIAATPPAPAEMRWYGWQTLVADAGAVGLFGLAAFAGGDRDSTAAVAVGLIGLSTYLAGGPIIHAAHGHSGKAGISVALRVGLPVLAWAIGFGVGSNSCHYAYDHEGCPTDYAAVATLFGVFTGVALDAALLGHEQAIAPPRNTPLVFFTPLRSGGGLSLAARF